MKPDTAFNAIHGIKGKCGARDVFLGVAPAAVLYSASFADTLNEDTGLGYQRPRDRAHSVDFRRYIHQADASTIPLTFNLRKDLKRNWLLRVGEDGHAVLFLRRGCPCLSQVNCQHRLGELGDSDIPLAFMAFLGLDLRGEMAMFTIINSKARGLSSSLTDFHKSNLLEDLAAEAPHLFLARRLNDDVQSPWFKRIRCGGHSTSGMKRRTSLRMMQHAIQRFLSQTRCNEKMEIEDVARLLIAYWRAVAVVFDVEWGNHRTHLITKGVGLYGLTHLLSSLVNNGGLESRTEEFFVDRLMPLKSKIDWGTAGTFSSAGGHKGAQEVHVVLKGTVRSMRVLLVEPQYRRVTAGKGDSEAADVQEDVANPVETRGDDTLWYPPLGLMKLARFHKDRGDEVTFVCGCDRTLAAPPDLFDAGGRWDRVYITTLFTFNWDSIVKTIAFYKEAVGGTVGKIYVGGVMASLMADDLYEETGVYPITGVLNSPSQIGLPDKVNIDQVAPDYEILDSRLYAVNDTYYGYTSRGCVNSCAWCGVPRIEPQYIPYIDIKPTVLALRKQYGDKPRLKLMDNNVLASEQLEQIVEDLLVLGYGRDEHTNTKPRRQRVVDFNQGLDASFLDEKRMAMVAKLNVKPMRIAFDRASEQKHYVQAVELAHEFGVREFSNYMLYNWKDTPRDLYDRLVVNIQLNEKWGKEKKVEADAEIYSYPMRFAPINSDGIDHVNRRRDLFGDAPAADRNWLRDAVWTRRFVRNIEIMKGAAHGAISPTPTLAWRTIGESYEEFLANLYMPEELLRNRNRHERRVHRHEPKRPPGSGMVEDFRSFLLRLLKKNDARFRQFHEAVAGNSTETVRKAIQHCKGQGDAQMASGISCEMTPKRSVSGGLGRQLLDVITSGMYSDPRMAVREYIQNAADSIDLASHTGCYSCESPKIQITLDGRDRVITIEDNGMGISGAEVDERLGSLGCSTKGGIEQRGFRGIGRLGGLAYCDLLRFETRRAAREPVHVVEWNGQALREQSIQGRSQEELGEAVRRIAFITTRRAEKDIDPDRFFRVRMINVHRFHSDPLMNVKGLREYLSQTAPVAFGREGFAFAAKIEKHVAMVPGYRPYEVALNGVPVVRPYREEFGSREGLTDRIRDIELVECIDRRGKLLCRGWYASTGFLSALPQHVTMRGLRIRQGNIAVGDEYFLKDLFAESRFATWHIGELHATPALKLNARRDGFEASSEYEDFLEWVSVLCRRLGGLCRQSSKDRSVQQSVTRLRKDIERQLDVPFFVDEEHARLYLEGTEQMLARLQRALPSVDGSDPSLAAVFSQRLVRLKEKPVYLRDVLDGRALRGKDNRQLLVDLCARMLSVNNGHGAWGSVA